MGFLEEASAWEERLLRTLFAHGVEAKEIVGEDVAPPDDRPLGDMIRRLDQEAAQADGDLRARIRALGADPEEELKKQAPTPTEATGDLGAVMTSLDEGEKRARAELEEAIRKLGADPEAGMKEEPEAAAPRPEEPPDVLRRLEAEEKRAHAGLVDEIRRVGGDPSREWKPRTEDLGLDPSTLDELGISPDNT